MSMSAIAKSLGADLVVYGSNQVFNLSYQSKFRDSRVQNVIFVDINEHILITCFDTDATEMALERTPPSATATGAARRKAAKAVLVQDPLTP
jgi:hypothetical protein